MIRKKALITFLSLGILLQAFSLWADDDAIMDLDNHTATFVGNWVTYRNNYNYGDNFRYAFGGGAIKTATFTTAALSDSIPYGTYEVFVRWTAGKNRHDAVRYDVYEVKSNGAGYFRGSCTKNQQVQGGEWIYCTSINLIRGSRGRVVVKTTDAPSTKIVVADAVRFVRETKDSSDISDEAGVDYSQPATGSYISSEVKDYPALLASSTLTCPGIGTKYVVAAGSVWVDLYGRNVPLNLGQTYVPSVYMSLSSDNSWNDAAQGGYGVVTTVTNENTLVGTGTISKTNVFTCIGGNSLTVKLYAIRTAGPKTFARAPSLVLTVYPTRY